MSDAEQPKPDSWDPAGDAEWNELQEYWKELRPPSPIILVSNRPSDLKSQLAIVAAMTTAELQKVHRDPGVYATNGDVTSLVSKGIEVFMQKWFEHLKSQDLAGLIEVVLEGQQLSPEEMKGFLMALPGSLLERITKASIGTVTGVHALVAFELHRRKRNITDYTLSKEGERTKVEFRDPSRQVPISFYLDDAVQGIPKEEESRTSRNIDGDPNDAHLDNAPGEW
jgi:hypothetical protein